MRSMFSGVSGLKVHQTKMDVIGNNISNVNTVGYKAQRVTFNEVYSQTLQGASAASDDTGRGGVNAMQVGLGVNVSSIDLLMTQGAAERTDNPFDLMVNGSGFLVVGDASGQYFTRNGALRADADGNLCIPNGMRVRGWKATYDEQEKDYKIVKGQVQDIELSSASTSNPTKTTEAKLLGNICATEDDPTQVSVSFYDSLGNYYKATFKLKKEVDGGEVTYKLDDATPIQVKDQNGANMVGYTVEMDSELTFNSSGKLVRDPNDPTANTQLKLKFTPDGDPTFEVGDENGEITIDCTDMTQYASKNTLTSKTKDGNSAGTMSGYSIGPDGIIKASYTNGDSRIIAQVVVAEFDNPAGLEKAGDNLFTSTANSGEFDGMGVSGNFNTGCLEMSNVDLSTEFTQMITTQRGFQANSRIISVSDEMLQELTNLKR